MKSNPLAILIAAVISTMSAIGGTENGWRYSLNDGCVTVWAYAGSATELIVPDTITNAPVTTLAPHALSNILSVTSIYLGSNVTMIGDGAFESIKSLKTIMFPPKATMLGTNLMNGCAALTNVSLPNELASIPKGMCQNCGALKWIIIPDGVTNIGERAFASCPQLETIIPATVTKIGNLAFDRNSSRLYFQGDMPDWTGALGWVLNSGLGWPTVYHRPDAKGWPNDIGALGVNTGLWAGTSRDFAFDWEPDGSNLTMVEYRGTNQVVTIPEGVETRRVTGIGTVGWGWSTGFGANQASVRWNLTPTNITEIILPNSITRIEAWGFYTGINSKLMPQWLTNISLPTNLAYIGDYAFTGCKLTSITIPSSVKAMGTGVFWFATNLESVYCLGGPPKTGVPVWDSMNGPWGTNSSSDGTFSGDGKVTAYWLPTATNWTSTFGGTPTKEWLPLLKIGDDRVTGTAGPPLVTIVEATSDLRGGWVPISTNSGGIWWIDSAQTRSATFYRARIDLPK